MVRTQQTASYLEALRPALAAHEIGGFREISAGIFEGAPVDSGLGRIGYFLIPLAWTVGLRSLPIPGGENGNGFDARVNDSIALVEADGSAEPVIFSHGATIMIWTMMNVDNPDIGLLLIDPLPNTGVVVVTGNAEDGWTLVSYDGKAVDPDPGLLTQLFVNTRDLIAAPQTAMYNVVQAIKTGDLSKVVAAVRDGMVAVAKAGVDFAKNTVTDIAQAVVGALPGSAQTTAATTVAATAPASAATAVQSEAPTADQPSSAGNGSKREVTETVDDATGLGDGNKSEPGRSGPAASRTRSPQAAGDKGGDTVKKRTGAARHSAEKAAA
jgi:broad specificity phosphatase PhoE